jgi:hypothetical protein
MILLHTAGEPWPDGGVARRAHSQFPSPVARSVGHSARLCTMFGHFVRMHFREIDGGAVDREIRPASHGRPTSVCPILLLTFECAWSISPRIRRVFSSPATIIYRNILYTRTTSFSRKKRAIHAGILNFPIFRSKIACVHIGYRGLNCGPFTAPSQFPSPVARSVGHSARLCTMFGHFVRIDFREIDGGAVDREIRPASHGPMGGWPDGHIHSFPAPWRGPLVIPRGSARCSDTL